MKLFIVLVCCILVASASPLGYGPYGRRGGHQTKIASQHSNSFAGDNGIAMSSGSANVAREKRTVLLPNNPVVAPVGITADGPAVASGADVAVREKRGLKNDAGTQPIGWIN